MKIDFRSIEPDGTLRNVEGKSSLESWRTGGGPFWADIESDDTQAISVWLEGVGIERATIDAVAAADSTGRVLPLDDLIFFEYPAHDAGGGSHLFAALCLDRLLITLHRCVPASGNRATFSSQVRLQQASTSGLACALAVSHSARLRRFAQALRDRARDLAIAMDADPEAVPLADILKLKNDLLSLDRMTDEQMAVFDFLKVSDKPQLNLLELENSFHLAVGNVQATDRRLERLDRVVLDLQRRFENLQQDKTNRRLGFLTIISAIFLPLTLMAGIYGMNFDFMPELHYKFSYPLALGGMAAVALGLFLYFRSRGWMD